MSNVDQEAARVGLDNLAASLKAYATARKKPFVGQFLDSEGCSESQKGIYGMSAWILLTNGTNLAETTKVAELRNQCKNELKALVSRAYATNEADLKKDPNKEEYAIRFVVPKIAWAFQALSLFSDADQQATALQSRIVDSQIGHRSWGYVVGDTTGKPLATAWVLRSFEGRRSFQANAEAAVTFLEENCAKSGDSFEHLFVLNTIEKLYPGRRSNGKANQNHIRSTIARLIKRVRSNPTTFANPINIDYNDSHRTRYFRLPSDVILLEALTLLSGNSLLYLKANPGKQVFKNVLNNLQGQFFSKDPSGHRASVGTYLHIHSALSLVNQKSASGVAVWLEKPFAWLQCAASFGANFSWNVTLLLISGIVAGTLFHYSLTPYGSVAIGVFSKTLVDLGKSLYDLYYGREQA